MNLGSLPPRTGPFRVLTICGSLRARSSNALALEAAAAVAPPGLAFRAWGGLATLPPFNPDQDDPARHDPAVRAWRQEVARADALLLSSPEYAHGVPGSLKNALDWLVSGPEFPAILVALLNTQPRATHAQAALLETLTTMSAEIVTEASIAIPLAGAPRALAEVLGDEALRDPLSRAMNALAAAMARAREANRRLVAVTVPPPAP